MPEFMRCCGVREMMGVGRGVEFLLGIKKSLLRVSFSTSGYCIYQWILCEPELGIKEVGIFSSLEGHGRVLLCLQTKAVNVCCLE